MNKTLLILGASGKIGFHSSQAFSQAGWTVKHFDRKTDCLNKVVQGVHVIVNGFNPPNYQNWKTIIPEITRKVIEAAKLCGATVILPGNVYHFGDQPGLWSEHTLPRPVSRKGEIRLAMEQAYAESGVQTIVLRAGNFIDPNRQGCIMSEIYLRNIASKKIITLGPIETRQAMCYLPDWARAAVLFSEMRQQLGLFEDIPFPGHTLCTADIKLGLEEVLETDLRYSQFPWWLFTLSAPFWEFARELNEMRYLWSTDHELCGVRFKALLPDYKQTDLKTVLNSALPVELQSNL
ncbi:NAD(P)H-binding protein [Hyphomicrobiales bacterium 4NK60-0047b]|jgi:nucleoside-diphosphate-sugar epimerase